ncbi:FAD:protein FMN transferase [Dysgonomonas sp. Marseille-P4361]|uniref:FAD:protein FMN transferase n=1 Tax=Dysgonomonas sp. Marseille-P4361 TaxID=2161820 RepID=UPI002100A402|nr:FAD:protein FMN transferase [Dysgonomonas sp. Marseille-P4361]
MIATSCKEKKESYFETRGSIFHTTYSVKYKHTHSLDEEITEKLALFDNSLNPFKTTSIISKVNNNESAKLDSFFINVFNKSKEVSMDTDGMFDITVSPLINAWGFGFKNIDNVSPEMIDSLKQFVGFQKIRLEDNKIIKDRPEIQINTSAIAKGYSTDVIAQLLESYGINNYMVDIGGEIRTKGLNAKGKCWQIGITQPVDKDIFDYEHLQTIIKLCDKSLATSGNYRKYYTRDGKRFAHTINPNTGYPSESNILSATIIADDCMTADAYATAFMLTDTATARTIAKKKGLSYLLILGTSDSTYMTVKSEDFDNYEQKQ